MAGRIIYAKKVREDDTEVEYQFWRQDTPEQVHTLWMIKATGDAQIHKDAPPYEAELIVVRILKTQDQKGDPTYWPEHVSHIG